MLRSLIPESMKRLILSLNKKLIMARHMYLRNYTEEMMPYIMECNVETGVLPERVLDRVHALVEDGHTKICVEKVDSKVIGAKWRVEPI